MERLSAYSSPGPNGSIIIDVEGMAVDLIIVLKSGGVPKEDFIDHIGKTWDEVHVTISIPNERKN